MVDGAADLMAKRACEGQTAARGIEPKVWSPVGIQNHELSDKVLSPQNIVARRYFHVKGRALVLFHVHTTGSATLAVELNGGVPGRRHDANTPRPKVSHRDPLRQELEGNVDEDLEVA